MCYRWKDFSLWPSEQSRIRIIEQVKFTNSLLGKAFEKQTKTIEIQERKRVEALKALKSEENKQDIKWTDVIFQKEMRSNESKNEIDEINKRGEKKKNRI